MVWAMTSREALDLIPYWQEKLRLRDWTIRGEIATQTEECPLGQAEHLSKYKDATIKILEETAIPASWLGNKDPEVTLVHELLHLQAESLNGLLKKKKNKRYEVDYERLVDLTACALVSLRRQTKPAVPQPESDRLSLS